MTDEEMAEEEKLALDYSYKVEPLMDVGIDNTISVYCRQDVEQAYLDGYLAGLKAGRPQWHKVADGDLPPEDTKVLVLMAGGEICIAHFYRKNVWDKFVTVIAWCEIPTFDKE